MRGNSSTSSNNSSTNSSLRQAMARIGLSRSVWLPLGIGIFLTLILFCLPYLQCLSHIGWNFMYWAVASGSIKYASDNGSLKEPVHIRSNGTNLVTELGTDIQGDQILVPSLLHQTWQTALVPERWLEAQRSCIRHHPGWTYRLWTDADALSLIQSKYPWFLDVYLSYPFAIQRADALRYFVLYTYGGVYLDLDIICLRPLDGLRNYSFIAPKTTPVGLSNDVLVSAKGSAFSHALIRGLPAFNRRFLLKYLTVMFSTGPMYLSIQYSLFKERAFIAVLPSWLYSDAPNGAGPNISAGVSVGGQNLQALAYFKHLQGSSWHESDAGFILWLGRHGVRVLEVMAVGIFVTILCLIYGKKTGSITKKGTQL